MGANDGILRKFGNVALAASALLSTSAIADGHPMARLIGNARASSVVASSGAQLPPPLVLKSSVQSDITLGHKSHSSHSSHSSHRSHYSSSARV